MTPPEPTNSLSDTNPTLAVVARSACVSVPTVSKVINGREDVAPETRRKVEEAIRRLGYVHKRRSDTRLPQLIDLVVRDIDLSRSPAVFHAAEAAAHAAGLDIVVSIAHTQGRNSIMRVGSLDRMRRRGTAGVLLRSTELSGSQHAWLTRHGVPCVLLDPITKTPHGIPTVSAAESAGVTNAVEHLRALGHDRIAVITGLAPAGGYALHIARYPALLDKAGIRASPEYTRYAGFDPDLAEQEMLKLLDLPVPPTAVLTCSGSMTVGALKALHRRDVHVPDDISIVGFEDVPPTGWMVPYVSAIQIPVGAMAAEAIGILIRMIGGEIVPETHVQLPTRLVVRQSTSSVRRASAIADEGRAEWQPSGQPSINGHGFPNS